MLREPPKINLPHRRETGRRRSRRAARASDQPARRAIERRPGRRARRGRKETAGAGRHDDGRNRTASSRCCRRTTTRCRWPCASGSSRIRQQVEDRVAKAAANAHDGHALRQGDAARRSVRRDRKANRQPADRQSRRARGRTPAKHATITIELKDEPFWPAIDQILDQAKLGVYSYGGEDALSIVARGDDDGPRTGRAVYGGPFRMEVLEVQAQRNLRQPKREVAQAATGSRLGAAAAADRALAAGRRCRQPRPTPAKSLPSASRKRCSMSKCRPARRRPKSCCRSSCRRAT